MSTYTIPHELDNTMTASTGLEFSTDFGRAEARRIEFDAFIHTLPTGESVELVIAVSHVTGGQYAISVYRRLRSDGFITVRVHKDSYYKNYMHLGKRYSSKNLEAVALLAFVERTGVELTVRSMQDWAAEIIEAY